MRFGIALGSNLGDRLQHLRAALEALYALHSPDAPLLISRVYETEPVDCAAGDPGFLNAVVEMECTLDPLTLLEKLQALEQRMGRPSDHARNHPRTIDLDILYADELHLDTPHLTLPHPRMTERRFVLAPLCDIRPHLQLANWPAQAADLLAQLPERPAATIFAATL